MDGANGSVDRRFVVLLNPLEKRKKVELNVPLPSQSAAHRAILFGWTRVCVACIYYTGVYRERERENLGRSYLLPSRTLPLPFVFSLLLPPLFGRWGVVTWSAWRSPPDSFGSLCHRRRPCLTEFFPADSLLLLLTTDLHTPPPPPATTTSTGMKAKEKQNSRLSSLAYCFIASARTVAPWNGRNQTRTASSLTSPVFPQLSDRNHSDFSPSTRARVTHPGVVISVHIASYVLSEQCATRRVRQRPVTFVCR